MSPPHGNPSAWHPSAWQLYIINYTLYIKRKQASPLHEEACLEFSFSLSKKLTDSLVFTLKSRATIYRPCLLWC